MQYFTVPPMSVQVPSTQVSVQGEPIIPVGPASALPPAPVPVPETEPPTPPPPTPSWLPLAQETKRRPRGDQKQHGPNHA